MTPGAAEHIDVALSLDAAGRVAEVSITSGRTVTASTVLEGRRPQDALTLIPLLFALCGTSQQVAGMTAVEAALGLAISDEDRAARALLVAAETVSEHATRMLVDWPPLAALDPAMSEARAVREAATAVQRALYPEPALRARPGDGTTVDRAALTRAAANLSAAWEAARPVADAVLRHVDGAGLRDLGATEARPLPALDPATLAARMAAENAAVFLRAPGWQGAEGFETGPVARRNAHTGLTARLAARLAETEDTVAKIIGAAARLCDTGTLTMTGMEQAVTAFAPADGTGLGVVEASRGRLVHYVEASGERIGRYRILAPTEWNFHPRGPLAQALHALPAGDAAAARAAAHWLVAALDPCVACRVTVADGGKGKVHA